MELLFSSEVLSVFSGAIVGLVLGLVGGGGSILAVPLLIYLVGIGSTHIALGTSAIAVALAAAVNLVPHFRAGHIKWRCAIVFSLAGIVGAFLGSSLAKITDGDFLLAVFGLLMVVVGVVMIVRRGHEGNPDVRLSRSTFWPLAPRLMVIGFLVGGLSGFFGIGGGFLIVPGLMMATGMPIAYAIGTSLISVSAFGLTTASNYAFSGLIDWPIAGLFILGGAIGGILGTPIGRWLKPRHKLLQVGFALIVIAIGTSIVWQNGPHLIAILSSSATV